MVSIPFVSPYPGVSIKLYCYALPLSLTGKLFGTNVYEFIVFPIFAFLFFVVVGITINSPLILQPFKEFPLST